ncbi:MAG: hypothetical protein M1820_003267 [Bogoriella megaspora]|nr:MAG: hypothetical protein M1820_003267 [Bogoriella megaspora]
MAPSTRAKVKKGDAKLVEDVYGSKLPPKTINSTPRVPARGSYFRFLDLPTELQIHILSLCVRGRIWIVESVWQFAGSSSARVQWERSGRNLSHPAAELALVSKFIRYNVLHAMVKSSEICFFVRDIEKTRPAIIHIKSFLQQLSQGDKARFLEKGLRIAIDREPRDLFLCTVRRWNAIKPSLTAVLTQDLPEVNHVVFKERFRCRTTDAQLLQTFNRREVPFGSEEPEDIRNGLEEIARVYALHPYIKWTEAWTQIKGQSICRVERLIRGWHHLPLALETHTRCETVGSVVANNARYTPLGNDKAKTTGEEGADTEEEEIKVEIDPSLNRAESFLFHA